MKLFKNIKKWLENQEHLFYLFLFILIVPNIVLCFTEPLSFIAKVCNVLLPFGCYYLLMTLSRNCGKMLWILFLFLFFGAFQIVLLYLFGQSIIAVDMFLNLVTTNSSEAMELLVLREQMSDISAQGKTIEIGENYTVTVTGGDGNGETPPVEGGGETPPAGGEGGDTQGG